VGRQHHQACPAGRGHAEVRAHVLTGSHLRTAPEHERQRVLVHHPKLGAGVTGQHAQAVRNAWPGGHGRGVRDAGYGGQLSVAGRSDG
jgi:hypothetical protein